MKLVQSKRIQQKNQRGIPRSLLPDARLLATTVMSCCAASAVVMYRGGS